MSTDPTKIPVELDPRTQRMKGVAYHGNTPFDCPLISHIEDNLWQGGCVDGMILPDEIVNVVSLYPWETYTARHEVHSVLSVRMYDSEEQAFEQVEPIAVWVNACLEDGPTLVHCQAGLNRSSLIAAASLMIRGRLGKEAIELLREKRSPAVLCNKSFERRILGE